MIPFMDELQMILVLLLRGLGLSARLVVDLNPIALVTSKRTKTNRSVQQGSTLGVLCFQGNRNVNARELLDSWGLDRWSTATSSNATAGGNEDSESNPNYNESKSSKTDGGVEGGASQPKRKRLKDLIADKTAEQQAEQIQQLQKLKANAQQKAQEVKQETKEPDKGEEVEEKERAKEGQSKKRQKRSSTTAPEEQEQSESSKGRRTRASKKENKSEPKAEEVVSTKTRKRERSEAADKAEGPPKKAKTRKIIDDDNTDEGEAEKSGTKKRKSRDSHKERDNTGDHLTIDLTEEQSFDLNAIDLVPIVDTTDPDLGRVRCRVWAEVWLEKENRWVQCCATSSIVDNPRTLATPSSFYITAFANAPLQRCVDVTRRYIPEYWSAVDPFRADSEWWLSIVSYLSGRKWSTNADAQRITSREEQELDQIACRLPLPQKLEDYRNHPVYCVKKFLRKNQVLHPERQVGSCKDNAVYLRAHVHDVHSANQWIKQGRQVRPDERPLREMETKRKGAATTKIGLFSIVQTDEFVAPSVVDGKVPKNKYGGLEVWGKHSLPAGTVHLRLQKIESLCSSMGIDFASAMVGYKRKSGRVVPVHDGVVVLAEHEDMLTDAWREIERQRIEKEKITRSQRAVANWARMTKRLLVSNQVDQMFEPTPTTTAAATTTSSFLPAKPGAHEHDWAKEFNEATGMWTKWCECGLKVEYEEI
eukprot:c16731_g1_i1.p1 GENE.c16731_g1_i1~~c16731_g1_i1.p1  ORF type:complete len:729 (+),score=163.98 c16731_g1_i1:78-2189(+)